jgi:serine/threonine protein phosphatase PrpC
VGLDLFIQPDIIQQKLREGDRLILCSDGVWSVIEDEEFAHVASRSPSVNEVSRNLIDLALRHDTDDNASVVMFHLHKLIPVSTEQDARDRKSTNWFQNLWKFVA